MIRRISAPFKVIGVGVTVAVMLVSFAYATPGSKSQGVREAAHQWAEVCSGDDRIARRAGKQSASANAMVSGLDRLVKHHFADRLDQLTTREACLSLIASAAAQTPVITVFTDNGESGQPRKRNADRAMANSLQKPGQKEFEKRLRSLDIGYMLAGGGQPDRSTPSNPFPRQSINSQIAFTAQNAYRQRRSFAGEFLNHCLIGLDNRPFSHHLNSIDQKLVTRLTPDDRQWLSDSAPAIAFWHEVAHCRSSPITTRNHTPETDEPFYERYSDTAQCSVASSGTSRPRPKLSKDAIAMAESLLRDQPEQVVNTSARNVQKASISAQHTAQSQSQLMDKTIIKTIAEEARADAFAFAQLHSRFERPIQGCREDGVRVSPWTRYRLMMSIYQPRPKRMSWLMPFLAGENEATRRQVIADAWKGLRELAFGQYESINRPMQVLGTPNPGANFIRIPAFKPDPDRGHRWGQWINHWFNG